MTKALVLRAPGINCDRETAYACRLAGFETELVHINYLLKSPERLLEYDFLVIPGGFSYGDDLGAGTLLAKNLSVHLGDQLGQFIDEGRPVLGICNGFQVLVRAGLLPGRLTDDSTHMDERSFTPACSLTDNSSAQFECRWISLAVQESACIFTQSEKQHLELPVAHGEGRFVLADPATLTRLQMHGQIPLVYVYSMAIGNARAEAQPVPYPDNPNGSHGNIAGICNAQGNVLGLMPHPERYVNVLQHPLRRGTVNGEGEGLLIFKNAYQYARKRERIAL
jgi:phosphoribosylformylglycinamidine synthase I